VARADSAKNDSLRIPEAIATEVAPPIRKNDLREGPPTLHREALLMIPSQAFFGVYCRKCGTKNGFRRAPSASRNPEKAGRHVRK